MQKKRNQNGNRYKTKKQLFNAIQKQKTENNIINLSNTGCTFNTITDTKLTTIENIQSQKQFYPPF